MKIDTKDVAKAAKPALVGAGIALLIAVWVPAWVLLAVELTAVACYAYYCRTTGKGYELFDEREYERKL